MVDSNVKAGLQIMKNLCGVFVERLKCGGQNLK
jgi:hypothetical protein